MMIIKDNQPGDASELRKRAEEIALEKADLPPESLEAPSPEKAMQMLHELRIHQIEMEMQIKELRRFHAELDAARARYINFYDMAPVGFCTVSEKGLIQEVNITFANLLGVVRSTLLKQPFSRFIHKEDHNFYYLHSNQLFATQSAIRQGSTLECPEQTGEVQKYDIRMLKNGGAIFWVHLTATAARDEDGAPVSSIIITDITERKQTAEALLQSEERFRKFFEGHSAVNLVIDPETGGIIDANEAAAKFYGWPLEELKHMYIQQINALPPEAVKTEMKKALSSEPAKFEFQHRKANGSIREVEVFTNKVEISGKNLLYSIIHDISERKRAEEMLKLHMAIMETVAEGIFLIGLEDNIIKWTNSKFEKLFGYDPGEMIGMHVDKVNAPTEKTPTETRISIVDILRQTGEWQGEIKSIKKNGTHFWCHIRVSLFNHPEFGTVMVSAHTDITDRKLAEAALQESETRFRTMANAMPQLAWIARADGHLFWYNQRWYEYTGMAPEQMKGWGWQSVHDPSVLPKVLARWYASLSTGEPFDMTFPLRGADGVFRPFLTRVIPLKDAAGRVLQWFGTNTDVSELKRVEQALRESETLYRSIGESIDYGVWVCEPDGRNTYASESFLKMVGITQEQCSNFGWGKVLHPDDAERTISLWQECVRTGGIWDIEHRFRGADGQWHPVLARGVPVRNAQGKITCWAGINLDISRLKHAEEQIKTSLAEKDILFKEVHHRVKNNLQVISSLINLQADCLADDQLQGVLADVRDRVRTMALVHEKLYQTNDLATLNFAEYVSSLLKYLWNAHSAKSRHLHLSMSLAPLILPVDIAVNCGLILNELTSNAIKHAFPGDRGGGVTVTLEHNPDTGAVCLRVRDDGIGFPADLDWRHSSSLGLRLVQMLAKQMRGTVQTGLGPGTEFQIRFNVTGNSS